MYVIKKKFSIDLAHIVPTQNFNSPRYKKKCRNIHGHTFTIIPIIKGDLDNKTRMVLDYTLLNDFKNILNNYLDHQFIIGYKNINDKLIQQINCIQQNINKETEIEDYFELNYYSITLDKVLFKKIGTITIVYWDSTTAEDLSYLLQYVLADTIIKTFEFNKDLLVNVTVKETLNSAATFHRDYRITSSIKFNLNRIYRLYENSYKLDFANSFTNFLYKAVNDMNWNSFIDKHDDLIDTAFVLHDVLNNPSLFFIKENNDFLCELYPELKNKTFNKLPEIFDTLKKNYINVCNFLYKEAITY